jgi:large subunit ribosomal protein L21
MFAIVKTGGKQYNVKAGDVIDVEKLEGNAGDKIELATVLAAGEGANVKIGSPVLAGAKVLAEIVEQFRDEKKISFKKRRRHNSRRIRGHRQYLTTLKVTEIKA